MKYMKHPLWSFLELHISWPDPSLMSQSFQKVRSELVNSETCHDLMPHGCHCSKCFTLPWHFIPFRKNQVKTIWWVSIKFQHLLQFFSARRLNLLELAGSRTIYEWANPIVLIYGAITETWSFGMDVWPPVTAKGSGKWVKVSKDLLEPGVRNQNVLFSNSRPVPSRVTTGKMFIFSEFQFQHFCTGEKLASEGLLWELNERKCRVHTAWHTVGGKKEWVSSLFIYFFLLYVSSLSIVYSSQLLV